jgi:integrase
MIRVRKFIRLGYKVSYEGFQEYLKNFLDKSPSTYNAELRALKRLCKFNDCLDLISNFKHAPVDVLPQKAPTTEQIRCGFHALETTFDKTLYLFIATSGLRKSEVLKLTLKSVDFQNRVVLPNHFTRTKRSGITFINDEALTWLKKYLDERTERDEKLFLISDRQWRKLWNKASEGAGFRFARARWHSVELGELGIGDRYIDTFQGRAPRSTLAKHYTSRGLDRLKAVYDSAGLQIGV